MLYFNFIASFLIDFQKKSISLTLWEASFTCSVEMIMVKLRKRNQNSTHYILTLDYYLLKPSLC